MAGRATAASGCDSAVVTVRPEIKFTGASEDMLQVSGGIAWREPHDDSICSALHWQAALQLQPPGISKQGQNDDGDSPLKFVPTRNAAAKSKHVTHTLTIRHA